MHLTTSSAGSSAGVTSNAGFTLLRLLVAISLLGMALTGSISGVRSLAGSAELAGASRVVRGHLVYARTVAIARREVVELSLTSAGALLLVDARDSVVRRTPLLGVDGFHLDSASFRPTTLRFNARGQAAPGSVYLHGGGSGVRLVMNFVGRVREEKLR
jgi:Tfp pilus assembly protein FimT